MVNSPLLMVYYSSSLCIFCVYSLCHFSLFGFSVCLLTPCSPSPLPSIPSPMCVHVHMCVEARGQSQVSFLRNTTYLVPIPNTDSLIDLRLTWLGYQKTPGIILSLAISSFVFYVSPRHPNSGLLASVAITCSLSYLHSPQSPISKMLFPHHPLR